MEEVINYIKDLHLEEKFDYNCPVILSFFFICVIVFIIDCITKGKSNKLLFMSYRGSIFNPLSYFRLVSHIFGHSDFDHLKRNFLYILLIGPMLEEKYGSINMIIIILITGLASGIFNVVFTNNRMLGASDIVYMLIILSSFVNITSGKIPITLILIILFYIIEEFTSIFKKKNDGISHISHLIGAIVGCIYGFYLMR